MVLRSSTDSEQAARPARGARRRASSGRTVNNAAIRRGRPGATGRRPARTCDAQLEVNDVGPCPRSRERCSPRLRRQARAPGRSRPRVAAGAVVDADDLDVPLGRRSAALRSALSDASRRAADVAAGRIAGWADRARPRSSTDTAGVRRRARTPMTEAARSRPEGCRTATPMRPRRHPQDESRRRIHDEARPPAARSWRRRAGAEALAALTRPSRAATLVGDRVLASGSWSAPRTLPHARGSTSAIVTLDATLAEVADRERAPAA